MSIELQWMRLVKISDFRGDVCKVQTDIRLSRNAEQTSHISHILWNNNPFKKKKKRFMFHCAFCDTYTTLMKIL